MRNPILAISIALALAAPNVAFADQKKPAPKPTEDKKQADQIKAFQQLLNELDKAPSNPKQGAGPMGASRGTVGRK